MLCNGLLALNSDQLNEIATGIYNRAPPSPQKDETLRKITEDKRCFGNDCMAVVKTMATHLTIAHTNLMIKQMLRQTPALCDLLPVQPSAPPAKLRRRHPKPTMPAAPAVAQVANATSVTKLARNHADFVRKTAKATTELDRNHKDFVQQTAEATTELDRNQKAFALQTANATKNIALTHEEFAAQAERNTTLVRGLLQRSEVSLSDRIAKLEGQTATVVTKLMAQQKVTSESAALSLASLTAKLTLATTEMKTLTTQVGPARGAPKDEACGEAASSAAGVAVHLEQAFSKLGEVKRGSQRALGQPGAPSLLAGIERLKVVKNELADLPTNGYNRALAKSHASVQRTVQQCLQCCLCGTPPPQSTITAVTTVGTDFLEAHSEAEASETHGAGTDYDRGLDDSEMHQHRHSILADECQTLDI